MFKIDPKPTTTQDGETKVCLSNIHSIAHPYNLPNHAIIDNQGEVLSDCSQQKHEEDFAYHLLEGMLSGQQRRLPAHEIGKYLSYHYQHTPPEERTAFCDWLKYTLPSYNQYFNVDLGRLQAITDWLGKSKAKDKPVITSYHLKDWVKDWPYLEKQLLKTKVDLQNLITKTTNGYKWEVKGAKYYAGLWLSIRDWKDKQPKPDEMAKIMKATFNVDVSKDTLSDYRAESKPQYDPHLFQL